MAKRRKKTISPAAVDRISELPEEIIHLILERLPCHEQAAKTSILSRRWLHLWRSYPLVEFHVSTMQKFRRRFRSFAASTSKRLLAPSTPLTLDSFIISLESPKMLGRGFSQLLSSASIGVDDDDDVARSPLKVVLMTSSTTVSLPLGFEGGKLLNCGRTRFLDLRGFDLSRMHNLKTRLDNLRELCMYRTRVSDQSFPSCLANASHHEKLGLESIDGINRLDISACNFPSLKSLSFNRQSRTDGLQQLQLSSAPLLHSITFRGTSMNVVTSLSAPSVEFLDFNPLGEIRGREFDDMISKLPSLESLDFNSSFIRGGDGIRISAPRLLKLNFKVYKQGMEFEIDAPNLVTLTIKSNGINIKPTVVNVAPNCRCLVASSSPPYLIAASWFTDLRQCLASLAAASFRHLVFELRLPYFSKSSLDLKQIGCESSPLVIQHLHLGTDLPLGAVDIETQADKPLLLDAILSAFHPKMLSVARRRHSRHNRSLFSVIYLQPD
ncbi:hypothetical protein LINGRAHAP2_LOCUS33408 [Linum grandiflorum]